jgi:threonine/homoserine/homoserine lactone efflux protein
VTGCAAATAEALYAAVAALGLGGLITILNDYRVALLVLSAAILVGLGTQSVRARPSLGAVSGEQRGLWAVYTSTVAVALPNPMILLPYAALCVSWTATGMTGASLSTISLVCGVFVGSMAWWIVLSTGIERLRGSLVPDRLAWINRVSGVLISAMGGRALLLALGA